MSIEVTVVLPTKRRSEFLKRAIRSIVSQSFFSLEIFVADNNSDPDLTIQVKNIIDGFKSIGAGLTWTYHHSTKKNAAGVRNDAMLAAKGKYIMFLDDDDELLSDSIKIRMSEMRADPHLALLYCAAYSRIYPYPFKMYRYYAYQKQKHTDRLETMSCSSIILNRQIILDNQLFFDEEMVRRHDYDFCRRVLVAGLKVKSIPAPLVIINLHKHERISTRPLDLRGARSNLIDKWGSSMENDIYNYAAGLILWRKCFGQEDKSYKELCADLQADFNRPVSLVYKIRLKLVCISPVAYLAAYHFSVMLSQLYKNRISPLLRK